MQRAVSPSMIVAAENELAKRPRQRHARKRTIEQAQETLDDLAGESQLSEHAYLQLANALKNVYHSYDRRISRIEERAFAKIVARNATVLFDKPDDFNPFTVKFLRRLLSEHDALNCIFCDANVKNCDCTRSDDWVNELVRFYMGAEDEDASDECIREGIFLLLEANAFEFGPFLMRFLLDETHRSPSEIFGLDIRLYMSALALFPNRIFFDWLVSDLKLAKNGPSRRRSLEAFFARMENECCMGVSAARSSALPCQTCR